MEGVERGGEAGEGVYPVGVTWTL